MPFHRCNLSTCECGRSLFLFPANTSKETIRQLSDKSSDFADVIVCNQAEYTCSQCGRVYELPPDELLDTDRSEWGKAISDMVDGIHLISLLSIVDMSCKWQKRLFRVYAKRLLSWCLLFLS